MVLLLCTLLVAGSPARIVRGQVGPDTALAELTLNGADVPISAGTDDAEEQGANGTTPGAMYLNSTDLELVADSEVPPFGDQVVGLRFSGIGAPQGATITEANITFCAVSADSPNTNDGATSLTIAGQAAANPATFATTRHDISSRPRTNATVAWSPAPWAAGTAYKTPSLAAIAQEIVNRADWQPGGSMAFIVTGSGSRSAGAYEDDPACAPVLHVAWESAANWAVYLPLVQNVKAEGAHLVNGDFEAGRNNGWQEYSAQGLPVVVQGYGSMGIAPHGGAWGAWLAGTHNEISSIEQTMLVPAERPVLAYWHLILSEDACGHDRASVLVEGVVVDRYDLCESTNTGGWARHSVDLSSYAGQTVRLQIRGETNGSALSHLLVDDVAWVAATAAARE